MDYNIPLEGPLRGEIIFPAGQNWSTLTKATKVTISCAIKNGDDTAYTAAQLHDDVGTIKLRGNTTAGFPKKPAALTLQTAATPKNLSANVAVGGMPAEKDWNLLAEWQDRTHFRTQVMNALCRATGIWSPRVRKIELYWKNVGDASWQYQGLYSLTEKVETGEFRINITETLDLTTDYSLEQQTPDQISVTPPEASFVDGVFAKTFGFKVPDGEEATPAQVTFIKGKYDTLMTRIMAGAFTGPNSCYEMMDVDSMVDYLLIQALGKNIDFWLNSWYIVFKTSQNKFFGGSFWDANGCLALAHTWPYQGSTSIYDNPNDAFLTEKCPYYAKLMTDPYFAGKVKERFLLHEPKWHQIMAQQEELNQYQPWLDAVGRDRAKWPAALSDGTILGGGQPYPTIAANTIKFLRDRLYWWAAKIYDVVPPKPVLQNA